MVASWHVRQRRWVASSCFPVPDLEVLHRCADDARSLPPVLFVHGAYMGAWCWGEHFMDWFASRGLSCHALSLRGHGESSGGPDLDLAGLDEYVDDVREAASGLSGHPVLVGHSMGGVIVQHYARTHPVAGLVLASCVPPAGLLGASIELGWREPDLYAQFALLQTGHVQRIDSNRLRSALFAPDMPPDEAMSYFRRMGRESQRVFAELAWPHMCSVRLARDVPVGVMGGGDDGLFRPDAVRATAFWHGVEAGVLSGLGHALMLDQRWQAAADWIIDWIETNCGMPPGASAL